MVKGLRAMSEVQGTVDDTRERDQGRHDQVRGAVPVSHGNAATFKTDSVTCQSLQVDGVMYKATTDVTCKEEMCYKATRGWR